MRFLMFDRITAFEAGKQIEGTKAFSLSDEALRGHFARRPVVPATLVLEAMVQLTGWLAIERTGFAQSVVLSVAEDAALPDRLRAGVRLDITGQLQSMNPKGSVATAWACVNGAEVARVGRILYAHVPHDDPASLRRQFEQFRAPA